MRYLKVLSVQGLCAGVLVSILIGLTHGAAVAAVVCVGTAAELVSALLTAATNGETDVIQMVQGTFEGHFTYTSSEPHGLRLEGGYVVDCASRIVDSSTTVLDGLDAGPVFILRTDQEGPVSLDGVTLQHGTGDPTPGVSLSTHGNLTLTNSLIRYNAGAPSEMVSSVELVSGATLTVANSTLSANGYAYTINVAMSGDTVIVADNTISGNRSRFVGGLAVSGNAVTVTNTRIIANEATHPSPPGIGGLLVSGGLVTITNTLIAKNQGAEIGGLIVAANSTILTNNTITGNTGAGMRVELADNSDTGKIYNNIIWNNSGPLGGDLFLENDGNDDGKPSGVELSHNDFDQSQSVITLPFPIDPSNLDHIDPFFVNADLDDYHLQAGSPVIDQGDNSAPGLPQLDQEGRPRILQGTVDLGAFEFGIVDTVHITRAAFVNRGLFLLISASSSATPSAQLFVTVSPCITNAPMMVLTNTYLYLSRIPSCGPLDGQTVTVHSSFGGSDSASLR